MATRVLASLAKKPVDVFLRPISRQYLISGMEAMARNGRFSGMAAKMMRMARDSGETRGSGYVTSYMQNISPFMDDAGRWGQFVDQLDKGIVARDPVVRSAAYTERVRMNLVWGEGLTSGISNPKYAVKDFFPHMWKREAFEGYNLQKSVDHLVRTGQAKNPQHARDLIERYFHRGTHRAYNLETPRRINFPNYRRDPAVIADHYASAFRRLEEVKILGKDLPGGGSEYLSQILSAAGEAGEDVAFARLVRDTFMGKLPGEAMAPWEKAVASWEAATKLSLAVVANATQPLNNIVLGGIRPFMRATFDVISDYGAAREFGLRTGSAFYQSLQEIRRIAGSEAETFGGFVLRWTGFSPIEKFNRIFSANVGKHFAHEQLSLLRQNPANRTAIRNLELLGINPQRALRSGLTPDDILAAGKRTSDLTQFRSTALDLPVAWKKSPGMRMLMMYKQFAFNQSKFLKDFAFKPAYKYGEFRPLMYMALVFPTFGEVAADLKTLLRKGPQGLKERPEFFIERMIDNFSQVGSLGLMQDLQYAMFNPRPDSLYSFAAGPVFSELIGYDGILQVFGSKDPGRFLGRVAVKKVPVAGPLAARTLYPPERRTKSKLQEGVVTKWLEKELRKMNQTPRGREERR